MEMREALQEKEDAKGMKAKQREKVRPKLGKIDIDYQKLHDAFFKWQTKPRMTMHGDLYYEGKEFEIRYAIWTAYSRCCGSMRFCCGSGFGSCYFRPGPSRRQQKTNLVFLLITFCLLKVHLHHFSKIKS
jgi:hypothetical protein